MNIMDGMDAARFRSANPNYKLKGHKVKRHNLNMPMVLRNLNNQ